MAVGLRLGITAATSAGMIPGITTPGTTVTMVTMVVGTHLIIHGIPLGVIPIMAIGVAGTDLAIPFTEVEQVLAGVVRDILTISIQPPTIATTAPVTTERVPILIRQVRVA